jgi:hypothetical protein
MTLLPSLSQKITPKKPLWKDEKSPSLPPSHKNPPTFSLLPKTSVIPCRLIHSIYFNYLPVISSRTPTPNNHPSEETKKKTKKNFNPLLPSP